MIVVSASTGRSSRLANNSRNRARASPGSEPVARVRLSKSCPATGPEPASRQTVGVVDSAWFGDAREVVGPRGRQDADQELQIVAVRPELTRQLVEQTAQFRIGLALEVIHRFDQAHAEETSPDAVDDRPGEIRVVGRGHPLGQNLAGVGPRPPGRRRTVQVGRLDDLLRPGNRQLPDRFGIASRAASSPPFSGASGGIAAKKAARLQNCSRFQLGERVIVALGTLEADAQENARHARGDVLGLAFLGRIVGRRRRIDPRQTGTSASGPAQLGREDLAHDLDRSPPPRSPSCGARPRSCPRPAGPGRPYRPRAAAASARSRWREWCRPGCRAGARPGPGACPCSGRRGNRGPRRPSGSCRSGRGWRAGGTLHRRRRRPA